MKSTQCSDQVKNIRTYGGLDLFLGPGFMLTTSPLAIVPPMPHLGTSSPYESLRALLLKH
eukprot:756649-Hanusia_phi.AAC.7